MKSTLFFLRIIKTKAKQLFLSWRYQSLNVPEAREYNLWVKKHTSHSHKKIKALLDDAIFWHNLAENLGFTTEGFQLKKQWEGVRRFADFNAQELMQFKCHTLDPYEITILRALEELHTDLKRYQLKGIWRPKWLLQWHQEKIERLEAEYQNFLAIKKDLQLNLLLQTRLYTLLGVSKYVDDVYLYFATKIAQLNVIHPNALAMDVVSTALNDDTRIAIHDFLSLTELTKAPELEDIIIPLAQKPYHVPIKPKQVTTELEQVNLFSAKVERMLNLTALARFKKEKKQAENAKRWLNYWILSPLSRFIPANSIIKKIKDIWYYRWLLALIMSVGSYVWLASAAITFIGVVMGSWAASMASNVLFYGVALLPAYVLGFKAFNYVSDTIYNALGYWKAREIQQSLELLKLNQRFVGAQLSCGIKEVAFFNIAQLERNALVALNNINKAISKLGTVRGAAKLVYWGSLKQANIEVIAKLKHQKEQIDSRLQIYASHVSERLEEDLATFHKNIANGQLIPTIPQSQVQALHQFVLKYGDIEAQKQFSQSTNVIELFSTNLLRNKLLFRVDHPITLNQPWGGYKSNIPSFKGWCTLIIHYEMDAKRKAAALHLIEILMGKKTCTPTELNQWVATVGQENQLKLMKSIQQHIFLTLDNQPSMHARLLSKIQKALIKKWAKQHEDTLHSASDFILSLNNGSGVSSQLCQMSDTMLIRYFEALEGLQRFHAIKGKTNARLEKAMLSMDKMLRKYDGRTAKAVYFLKFLPPHLKKDIAMKMVASRVRWLVNHLGALGKNVFESEDTELFKHPILEEKTIFSQAIRAQDQYMQPWNEQFRNFLLQCKHNGFDDGTLFQEYEDLNARIKNFVKSLQQDVLLLSGTACRSSAANLDDIKPTRMLEGGIRCV